jgi:hypothetical protein
LLPITPYLLFSTLFLHFLKKSTYKIHAYSSAAGTAHHQILTPAIHGIFANISPIKHPTQANILISIEDNLLAFSLAYSNSFIFLNLLVLLFPLNQEFKRAVALFLYYTPPLLKKGEGVRG